MTKEIFIIDAAIGTETQRPMTEEEIAEFEYRWRDPKEIQAAAEATAKKAAAEAKLAALGLTADDLKALGLGGN